LPVNYGRDIETIPPQKRGVVNFADMGYASSDRLQWVKALYSRSLINKGVGRILRALDELGLTVNTLVVFTSDHAQGDHGL
jgi:membrane-anchored protein YejM (alkaline phosphatase superfamily)